MVEGALSGRVGALFMYGQTGSGKTHTMEAIEKAATSALFRGVAGIVPGAASVRVAYFEIAGKKCTDLLSPTRTEIALKEVGGGAVGAGAGAAMDPSEYRSLARSLVGAVASPIERGAGGRGSFAWIARMRGRDARAPRRRAPQSSDAMRTNAPARGRSRSAHAGGLRGERAEGG